MERIFHLKENGTTIKTEILAGLTTFMTMAYIIALNPNLLTNFAVGTPLWNGVFLATCIASAIGTVCMAFLANKPFVMAPGMGLNSFFAVIAGNVAAMLNTDYTSAFQAVLCIILVEGIVFLLLSVFNIRDKIVDAIPLGVRLGIGPAIGLMLMNIGLGSNVGIYAEGNGYTSPFYVLRDFFGAMTPSVIKDHMGAEYSTMVLTVITMFIGLFVIILLAKKGVKAAVLVGMLVASVIYWAGSFIFLKVNPFASLEGASFLPPFQDMVSTTLFKFDFPGFFRRFPKWLKAVLLSGVGLVLAVALAVLAVMGLAAADRPSGDDAPNTVVLLGCQVYNGRPSMMLQGRIEAAYQYLTAHPDAVCVTTGGRDNSNETVTEGGCAARELMAMGIAPERIYAEEKSFDTRENLLFAADIIRENGLDTHVVIASDNFHQYRGQLFARQAGLEAQSAGCFSPWFLGAGYACREVVGILATWAGIA